ncbi:MAG: cell division protein ZapA [Bacteroidia bacterium]|nr:cell division protein ZapA [Bacteroidia bacterium]MDW8334919.1 cell division protein ZapA [Bacteroidia bacterium]
MDKRPKTIRLLNRNYVVNVTPAEEPLVESAVDLIEAKVGEFKAKFKALEDVDAALMCCLDLAAEWISAQEAFKAAKADALARLAHINAKLQQIV